MVQRLLSLVVCLGLLAGASATCLYETRQYGCYESTGDETASEIATKRHLSPLKLCDWNRYELGVCELETKIPKGFHLKVPRGECVPKPGVWTCYQVEAGDDLHTIAFGPQSLFRSTEKLKLINKDVMWGNEGVFKGMHLRLPVPWCIPDYESKPHKICHTVKDGDDLTLLAKMYNTTIPALLDLNNQELAGLDSVLTGMQLHVHHPCPDPPTTPFETWSPIERRFWTVHVVIPGDTLYVIGQKYKFDYNLICQLNKIVDCSKFGSIITVGQVLTLPVVKTCTPVEGQQVCITVKNSDVGLKQVPISLAGLLASKDGQDYHSQAPALGASQKDNIYPISPSGARNGSFAYGNFGDWPANEFLVDFVSKLWNLNKPLLADTQYSCGPAPRDPSAACLPAHCASSADAFRLGTCTDTSREGKCIANDGCIIEPLMTIAVPYIPCIPDDAHTCFKYTDLLKLSATSNVVELENEVLDWVLNVPDFVKNRFYDDYNRAVLGEVDNYGCWNEDGTQCNPPGLNSTSGSPSKWNVKDVEVRFSGRLPGPDGNARVPTGNASDMKHAHQDPSVIKDVFCNDVPGASGHHCFKLVVGPGGFYPPAGGPGDYNESLYTVSQATGVPVADLCSKYHLANCSFISVVTAVEIPNSAPSPSAPTPAPPGPAPPTPAPKPAGPTPAPGGQCTGCIGGSHGECKAASNVCFPATAGACPTGTTHC